MDNSQQNLQSETIDKNTIMQLMREIMEQEGRKIIAPMLEEKMLEQPTVSKIYGEEWIVLQNRLLNAISNLELNERRLIMFLSPLVRKEVDKNPYQSTFIVRVKDFQDEYGIKSKAYYQELENICNSLQHKTYEFWNFSANKKYKSKVKVTWITKGDYKDNQGEVHIDLHNDVIEMLTVFDKTNPFTKYQRQMIVKLGCYGIILFELISSCLHQKNKTKAYTIEYLREKFNCIDTYPVISEFKRNVLDKAIMDIEKHTPLRITYTQVKKGRVVTEIVFAFENLDDSNKKVKNKKSEQIEFNLEDAGTRNNIKLLSSKQADFFANKLANDQNFSGKFAKVGEDMKPFVERLSHELQRDISQVAVYMPYLLELGFKQADS
ncbi:replication initiation protein [Moraxella sp. CTOTU49803]|uniref:replication initiation protein n=1 Tax=Moraxella sp. CTOTU49803 TaxID=2953840 RepID=UPI0003102459|nr:replication initiation protein [Moraxella sp. CTOTU49803]